MVENESCTSAQFDCEVKSVNEDNGVRHASQRLCSTHRSSMRDHPCKKVTTIIGSFIPNKHRLFVYRIDYGIGAL
ncbi:hypothetical protein GOP47_0000945 [Adiantum capillus-veneris]|uniref:Uncharacterized protein n=1 Tax=Adiantum capillus-veneris TaxID=13818 RepID=A0A9D4ZSR8_ADICA|nr:hypothetical protein GOP47_0000945 [Adiantum capillus-veneris]